jgi:anti-sigma B factor antagonist
VGGDEFDVQLDALPGGGALLRISGELDLATTPEVETLLESGVASPDPLVVDLSGCTFLDSSGVRSLVTIARRAEEGGTRFAVVASDPSILRVLEITSLGEMVSIHPTLDAAR